MASLIHRVRRKPEILREIMAGDERRASERQHIIKTVQISTDFGRIIDSAKDVAKSINSEGRKPVKDYTVRSVMR